MKINRLQTAVLLLILPLFNTLLAQEWETVAPVEPRVSSDHISLSFLAGPNLTSPNGMFPSLIFVELQDPTGAVSEEQGRTGLGHRWVLDGYFPTGAGFGISVQVGSRVAVVRYEESDGNPPIRMNVQTMQVGPALRYYLFEEERAVGQGEVSLGFYLDGGLSFGFGPVADRVESTISADSAGRVLVPVSGSFQGGDPFCTEVGLRGAGHGLPMIGESLDIVLGASFTQSLTTLFSDDALPGTDLDLSHVGLDLGIGYRF